MRFQPNTIHGHSWTRRWARSKLGHPLVRQYRSQQTAMNEVVFSFNADRNTNAANLDHLQLLSLSVKDPRPPVERAPLPERSLGGGAIIGERHPPKRARGRRTPRQFAAERRDPGREGRALGKVVRRTEERTISLVFQE